MNINVNPITYNVAMEVAAHEAVIRQAYKDSGGVWTWSVGLTSATGHDVKRYIGKPQTIERCLEVYVWALDRYADHVRAEFPEGLPEHQFAAALSFVWNLGQGNFKKASWVGHFKRGDMAAAERAWKLWNKADGKVLPGLVTRRQKECDLFFRRQWSHQGTMVEYTKLTSRSTPVWSSAKKINVEKELRRAIVLHKEPEIDTSPEPFAPQPVPTIGPHNEGKWSAVIAAMVALAGAIATFLASGE